MHEQNTQANEQKQFTLPETVVSRVDVARMLRELKAIDEFMLQAKLTGKGVSAADFPRASNLLEGTAKINGYNLLDEQHRTHFMAILDQVKKTAPVVHMSFAADPSGQFVNRVIGWFRREAHPFVLLQVGLQPELAAGCVLRTENKFFDMSFRHRFDDNKQKLRDAIGGNTGALATPESISKSQQPVVTEAAN